MSKHLIQRAKDIAHGTISWVHGGKDGQYCEAGDVVAIDWQPSAGWGLQEAHYIDEDGNIVPIDLEVREFTMPAKAITIGGTFMRFVVQDWTEGTNPNTGKPFFSNEHGSPVTADLAIPITYSELVALRDGGKLTAGMWYRITDYTATTKQAHTIAANLTPFDILVFASSQTELNENAFACKHEGVIYNPTTRIEAWRLKYCIDNDESRFRWADLSQGKGVVYRLVDEWNNDVGFDFKNIGFLGDVESMDKRIGDVLDNASYERVAANELGFMLFTWQTSEGEILDASVSAQSLGNDEGKKEGVKNNYIGTCYDADGKMFIPIAIMVSTYDYEVGFFYGQYGCTYKGHSDPEEFAFVCGNYCSSWTCGNYCYSWTCGNDCNSWTCGNYCSSWTCGNDCNSWTCGDNCYSWTCGNGCNSWTCGNYCSSWTCGDNCYSWTCGNDCYSWTCGNYCYSWTCGDNCSSWTCGDNCYSWTCGNDCYSWTCGNGCVLFHLMNGTAFANQTTINFASNVTYAQFAGLKTDGTLQIFTIDDII